MTNNDFDIKNIPLDFFERMKLQLGDSYEAFLSSYDKPYRGALRLNGLKFMKSDFAASNDAAFDLLKDTDFELEKVPWSKDGYYYSESSRPGKHPFHDCGLYYMQEPSAMIVASLTDASPSERVLDLCAAPGGKTTALAASMQGEGILVSNEIHPRRAAILSQNVERMGIRNCFVTNASPSELSLRFENFFDKVIVDAPCSGEGMFRKEPDAIKCWSKENIDMCASRGKEILEEAAKMLAGSGTLIYSTCTFAPEEDELQIEDFLKSHPDFSLESSKRLWPHEMDGEGHFVAVLRKNDSCLPADYPLLKNSPKINKETLRLWKDFEAEMYKRPFSGTLISYGDNLYLAPANLDLEGLRCLRPGLCLGSVAKDRFVPSFALALATRMDELKTPAASSFDLNYEEAKKYINGETIRADHDLRGWVLVTYKGISLSWGKCSNGMLKNHYPKGLRHA